jgi:hypothetical protein
MTPDQSVLTLCRSALIDAFKRSASGVLPDKNGYVQTVEQNLVGGVRLLDFESDLRQGDGNELETKFRAVHSSAALAVNTFAPFIGL